MSDGRMVAAVMTEKMNRKRWKRLKESDEVESQTPQIALSLLRVVTSTVTRPQYSGAAASPPCDDDLLRTASPN